MPRALAAASAWRVRSPIMCRSCSAAAASTALLTTEKIRALVDNIRGKKDRDIAGDAAVHTAVRAGLKRIHFIAPTTTDFHDVNVEGKSGIFATCGRDPRPRWVSSRRRLEWPNGAMCVFFSGEEPESLRG